MLAQSINYHITIVSSCIIYPIYLFLYLVSKASSGSHTKLTYLLLKMYCHKYCKAGLRSEPSLLTVWSFYGANLGIIYSVITNSCEQNQKRSLSILFSSQSISNSSSDIILQGNSTKHCPSWDLLCQDSSKQISNSNAVRLVLFSNRS